MHTTSHPTRWSLLGGTAAGAAMMFLLDPALGRRRRALMRDKLARAARKSGQAVRPTAVDMRNRAYGTVAMARSRFRADADVFDEKLVARVRSELGRVVSHPSAIEVTASEGCVTLAGPILADEEPRAIKQASRLAGVRAVVNLLEAHDEPDDVPALQGGQRRVTRLDIAQTRWAPATRLLSSVAGALLGLYGAKRRGLRGFALSAFGFGLVTRAATNLDAKRLAGVGTDPEAGTVDVQKTLRVQAPVDLVFRRWTDYRSFPRFMSNVLEVQDRGEGRSHWVVAGPARIPIEWDAIITEYKPLELIAWRTEPGSPVQHAGCVRFERDGDAARVHVRLSYTPPAGALGHVVAKLFGADPKSEIDADLLRMKSLLETGKQPHDAAQATA